jgi:23S rRNA (uridine2552-2'-O)-methyltransferase
MRRSVSKQNRWSDHYTQRAKREKYPARSVYKLDEIQRKFGLIKKGDKVLDLGCFPGSWLLYAADLTKHRGRVVGIDLKPVTIQLPPHVTTHTGDIFSLSDDFFAHVGLDFNVVLSDMAPATTGQKNVDSAHSFELCRTALAIAQKVLLSGGSFVCKIFHGEDVKEFSASVRDSFRSQKVFKPQSSRKASKEIFVIGLGFKA